MRALFLLSLCGFACSSSPPTPSENFTIVSTWPGDTLPPSNPNISNQKHALDMGWSSDSATFMLCNSDDLGVKCIFAKPFVGRWVPVKDGSIFQSQSDEPPEEISTYDRRTKSIDAANEKLLAEKKAAHTSSGKLEGLSLVFTTNASPNKTEFSIGAKTTDKRDDSIATDSINRWAEYHVDAVVVSPDAKCIAVVIHSNRSYEAKLFVVAEVLKLLE